MNRNLLIPVIFCICILCISTAFACSGCGCRGGPGYRGPDGHCVGAASLKRVCGDPPTKRCTQEDSAQSEHKKER